MSDKLMQTEILDHRDLLKSLSAAEREQLTAKSNLVGLLHLSVHLGAIIFVGALIYAGVPGWQLLMVIQGALIVFLFTLLHETTHETPFHNRYLNTIVGSLCGFAIMLPLNWFRYFHFAHHRHTHDLEKDPELQSRKPETWGEYFVYVSGLPVWGSHVRTLLVNGLGNCADGFVPAARLGTVRREAQMLTAAYILLMIFSFYFNTSILLYIWVVPLFFGQPFLRLYLLAEHGHCPHVANMFENTRTTFTNRVIRCLAWNMPYHAEHHAFPNVPFYLLPKLHERTRQHLLVTENGYHRFTQSYVSRLNESDQV